MANQQMQAWRLTKLGGELRQKQVDVPEVRAGSVLVRVEACALMSYLKSYVEGELPFYTPPRGEYTIGTNGVGVVDAVGRDVWHIKVGQRVLISSHFRARDNVDDPGQILIGLTAGAGAQSVLDDWPDGTLAEYTLVPVEAVTPVDGLDHVHSVQLAALSRFIIPFGGLRRGRLTAGETIVVTGATGAYGTAAVLLAVAMGASRVIAVGRNQTALDAIARIGGARVRPVTLSGHIPADTAAIQTAAEGGVDIAFDMVGNATDPNATLASLHSLRRAGRLVLMGSMTVDLPIPYKHVMRNSLEILGQFMYPVAAYRHLIQLVRTCQIDLSAIQPLVHPFEDLPAAMQAAAVASNIEYVVVRPCP